MHSRLKNVIAAALVAVAGTAASAQTPVDTAWTYQGKLTDNAAPANGPYDLRFSLFIDDQGTLQNGGTLDMPGIQVDAGLFTAKLDFGALFTGNKNWLLVEVSQAGAAEYTALPLQEITSVPQSLFSQLPTGGGVTLPYEGTGDVPSPNALFKLSNTNPDNGSTLWCQTEGTNGIGIYSSANATTGFAYGGIFESASSDGRGINARALATTGLAIGGRFSSASTAGIGVYSTASAATGASYGVFGESLSTSGSGVYGYASSTTGFNFGGHFFSNSPDGRAVRAVNNAVTGQAVAGRFATGSPAGLSIWTTASATSGVNYGIYADTNSAAGYGGYFRNSAGGAALFADGLAKVKTLQILGGSDLAEPFDVAASSAGSQAEPGMVVVIDAAHPGDLRMADRPYDGKVAGVISGANNLQPGMVMSAQGQEHADGKHPVAMTGRVWVYVDASYGAVSPGDLLTTSATPGHAMLASDHGRAFGAVIGKAMTELKDGKGLVLVLVNLQ